MSEMMVVRTEETKKAIAIAVQGRLPVLLWGAPGTGKTETIKSIASALSADIITLIASIHEPSDFAGLPFRVDGATDFLPPAWFKDLLSSGRLTIVFFDEIDKAPRSVQAALLRLILERRLHSYELPPTVRFVAAANPPDKGGDWELSPPLANRFIHLDYTLDADIFTKGFVSGDWGDSNLPIVDEEKMVAEERKWRAIIAAFIQRFPSALLSFPQNASEQGRAWASPRTWEYCARALAACDAATPSVGDAVRSILVSGCVGGRATEFLTFVERLDVPSPEEVLGNFSLLPVKHPDKLFVVLASIPAYLLHHENPQSVYKRAVDLIIYVEKKAGIDFAVIYAKWLKGVREKLGLDIEVMYEGLSESGIIYL